MSLSAQPGGNGRFTARSPLEPPAPHRAGFLTWSSRRLPRKPQVRITRPRGWSRTCAGPRSRGMIRTGHRGVVGETAGSLMGRRRVDLQTAAQLLGLSADAVRKRAKRGNMDYETGADGKLYVWVDDRETTDYPTGDRAHQPESDPRHGRDELVEELRERVLYLERQVEEERDARRRADRLLARLIERVPELQAPREARESPKSAVEAADTTKPRSATERPQEPSSRPQEDDEEGQRSPWWRRLFE